MTTAEALEITGLGQEFREFVTEASAPELKRVLAEPERLTLELGHLSVTIDPPRGEPGVIAPQRVRVALDGKPLRVRRLAVFLDVEEVPRVELDFYPEG